MAPIEELRERFDVEGAKQQAQQAFSASVMRHLRQFGAICGLRNTVGIALGSAHPDLVRSCMDTTADLASDPAMRSVFNDPRILEDPEALAQMAQDMAAASCKNTEGAVDAASLVFAHAVLDAAVSDFCHICATALPMDWFPLIRDRKIDLATAIDKDPLVLLKELVTQRVDQLERESLSMRIQVLHKVCKPPEGFSPLRDFAYDPSEVDAIDAERQRILHDPAFHTEPKQVEASIFYLMRVMVYLVAMIHEKYGLQVDVSAGIGEV